tara:strand:+ start:988 stop:1782 length:795 start_codon:yes stop_codon:yes gene_type:complete
MKNNIKELQFISRKYILDSIYNAQSSHVGSALSCIDILIANLLFLKEKNKVTSLEALEKIILSKGHGASAFYGLLSCFDKSIDPKKYYQNNSWYTGHISHEIDHITHSTGSLGHGLPVACGIAFANRKKLLSVVLSDGEIQEGSNWEAIMVAPKLGLNNLFITIDYNNQQSFGKVSETMNIDPLEEKFESFGWNVKRGNGHEVNEMIETYKTNCGYGKPFAFIAETVKGKGVSFMENQTKWHYSPPNSEEYDLAIDEIIEKYKT